MRYDPYNALIAPARTSASLWHLAIGIVAFVVFYFGLTIVNLAVNAFILGAAGSTEPVESQMLARTSLSALLALFSFGFAILALHFTLRVVHNRTLIGLIGPLPVAITLFRRICIALLILHAVLFYLPTDETLALESNLPAGEWLVLLPLGLLGLLIQTSAEELIFRGYLQSQLAARFSHPAIWIIVPSVLFGLLHYDTEINGANTWLVVGWAVLFGIAAADLTARSGSLAPAIALHFINNFFAILIASPGGYFDGLSLYTYPFAMDDTEAALKWAPVEMLLMLCTWLAARLVMRR